MSDLPLPQKKQFNVIERLYQDVLERYADFARLLEEQKSTHSRFLEIAGNYIDALQAAIQAPEDRGIKADYDKKRESLANALKIVVDGKGDMPGFSTPYAKSAEPEWFTNFSQDFITFEAAARRHLKIAPAATPVTAKA